MMMQIMHSVLYSNDSSSNYALLEEITRKEMLLKDLDVIKNLFCLEDLRDRVRQFWIFWPSSSK